MAEQIEVFNTDRRALDQQITEEALTQILENDENKTLFNSRLRSKLAQRGYWDSSFATYRNPLQTNGRFY